MSSAGERSYVLIESMGCCCETEKTFLLSCWAKNIKMPINLITDALATPLFMVGFAAFFPVLWCVVTVGLVGLIYPVYLT
jgi:hypothetical protein